MISKLTKKQEELIPVYLDKWMQAGHRVIEINRDKARESVNFLYEEILGIEKPEVILFFSSPMLCQLAINSLKYLGNKMNEINLDSQLHSQLRSQLHSQLGSQLDSQLRSQLYSQLRSQLRSQLSSVELEFYSDSCLNWYPRWWWFWTYDYILNEIFPDKKKQPEFVRFNKYMGCLENLHLTYLFNGIAIISDFPREIIKNENGLHNTNGSSLKYSDDYSLYALDGIRIDKEMLNFDAEQIMAVENTEQRLVLIKNYGIDKMLHKLKSRVISEGKFPDSDELVYKLHEVEIEGEKEKLFEMQNPSEDKKHFEWVIPECKTIFHADMWRRGYDNFNQKYIPTDLRA